MKEKRDWFDGDEIYYSEAHGFVIDVQLQCLVIRTKCLQYAQSLENAFGIRVRRILKAFFFQFCFSPSFAVFNEFMNLLCILLQFKYWTL